MSRAPDWQLRTGLGVTAAVLLIALLGPIAAPHDPLGLVGPVLGGPAPGAPLGYDLLGRDVLSRVLAGGRTVVITSVATVALALVVGTALGVLAGTSRRGFDASIVWCADVLHAFPSMILVLLVVAVLGRHPGIVVATAALTLVPGVVRLVRGMTVAIAQQEFIEAARLAGVSRLRLCSGEILPNIATPLLVHVGTMVSWAVAILSGLAFLGYGVAPPAADWGLMANENRLGLALQPWGVLAPVLLIAAFALGTNLLAVGLGARVDRQARRSQP